MTEYQQRKKCEEVMALLYAKAKRGEVVSSRQYTFQDFAEMWIQEYPPAAGLSPKTVEGYRLLLEGRLYKALGHIKLHQLTPQQITRFYRLMLEEDGKGNRGNGKKLTASTVLHYHRLLRSMLNTAVKWGIIASNPAQKANTPKNDTKRMKAYDQDQAATLLEKLQEAPLKYQVGVALGLLGQLRKGEIAGLNWGDVNFEKSTLRIERSAVYISGQGVILKDTKTEAGRRVISLPQVLMILLRKHKAAQAAEHLMLGESWEDSGAILAQWNGARQHPDTISKWFHGFLEKHNLPPIRFHDLRHTGASLLMNVYGEPTQTVTERLGHSNASVTLSFYSHGYMEKDRAAADWLGDTLTAGKGRI